MELSIISFFLQWRRFKFFFTLTLSCFLDSDAIVYFIDITVILNIVDFLWYCLIYFLVFWCQTVFFPLLIFRVPNPTRKISRLFESSVRPSVTVSVPLGTLGIYRLSGVVTFTVMEQNTWILIDILDSFFTTWQKSIQDYHRSRFYEIKRHTFLLLRVFLIGFGFLAHPLRPFCHLDIPRQNGHN